MAGAVLRMAALAALMLGVAAHAPAQERAPLPEARPKIPRIVFVPTSGRICGDPGLVGRELPAIEAPGYCGIPRPVLVERVSGVAITPPIRVNCRTARALADWVRRGPGKLAPEMLDARLVEIRPSGAYSCRTRNFRTGGRLSEHAAGNAVDIPEFRLSDGRRLTLAGDWGEGDAGRYLRAAWRAACGPFGTVLGPDHDKRHRDHFHLDTATRLDHPVCR